METLVLTSQDGKRLSCHKVMRSKSELVSRRYFVETLRTTGLSFLGEPFVSELEDVTDPELPQVAIPE